MTRAECENGIAKHFEAIIQIAKEFDPELRGFCAGFATDNNGTGSYFLFGSNLTEDGERTIDLAGTIKRKWRKVGVEFDYVSGTFRVLVDGKVEFEHLAQDEVAEVVRNLMP